MCCRKLIIVVMLIIVLDAAPKGSKKRKLSSEVVTRKKYAITYIKSKQEMNFSSYDTPIPNGTVVPGSVTPGDDGQVEQNKNILHKLHKNDDLTELLVKPLEVDGVVSSGINSWLIFDDQSQISDSAEEFNEYYEEFTEEHWKETIFEYDVDDW